MAEGKTDRTLIEGRGRLLTNDKKRTEKSPDFRGDILYQGKLVKLSAWKKQTPFGELISLSIDDWKPGDAPPPAYPGKEQEANRTRGNYSKFKDEDIPFLSMSLSDDVMWKKLRWCSE